MSLEPAEAVRCPCLLRESRHSHPANTHPVYPVGVIKGELEYPPVGEMRDAVKKVIASSFFVDATGKALALGNPILANIVMIGALGGLALIPFDRDDFRKAIALRLAPEHIPLNLQAFDAGFAMVRDLN